MKKLIAVLWVLLSMPAMAEDAEPVGLYVDVEFVFSGYKDGSILFVPQGKAINPAECENDGAYVMPSSYDADSALGVLLTAMTTDRRVYISVLEDECHSPENSDLEEQTYPVFQRVGVMK